MKWLPKKLKLIYRKIIRMNQQVIKKVAGHKIKI